MADPTPKFTVLEPSPHCGHAAAMDDEPIFTLLARDAQAPVLVNLWAQERMAQIVTGQKPLEDMAKVNDAVLCADAMKKWRAAHIERVSRQAQAEMRQKALEKGVADESIKP